MCEFSNYNIKINGDDYGDFAGSSRNDVVAYLATMLGFESIESFCGYKYPAGAEIIVTDLH